MRRGSFADSFSSIEVGYSLKAKFQNRTSRSITADRTWRSSIRRTRKLNLNSEAGIDELVQDAGADDRE